MVNDTVYMYEQGELFPVEQYDTSVPLLNALELTSDNYERKSDQYFRIALKPGADILVWNSYGEYTDKPQTTKPSSNYREFESITWQNKPSREECYDVFVLCATRLNNEPSRIILHTYYHVTDYESSVGFYISDVAEVSKFPDEFAEVLRAYQNAEVDRSTLAYQRLKGLPLDISFTPEELAPYVTSYKPEPSLCYRAQDYE